MEGGRKTGRSMGGGGGGRKEMGAKLRWGVEATDSGRHTATPSMEDITN